MEVRLKGRNPRSPGCDDQSVDQKDYGHAHAYLLEAALLDQSDSIRLATAAITRDRDVESAFDS